MKIMPNSSVFVMLLICSIIWAACIQESYSCDSCGRECAAACGTRHFRTCCFNYLRKRSSVAPFSNGIDSSGSSLENKIARARMDNNNQLRHNRLLFLKGLSDGNDLPLYDGSRLEDNDIEVEYLRRGPFEDANGILDHPPQSQGARIFNESS